MDPITNPFAPGAGTQPPELAGRDALRETTRVALERIRLGRPQKSVILVGLRGVGKTVLLERMRRTAAESGMVTLKIEAREGQSLPALLAPTLRLALLQVSRLAKAKNIAQRGLRALAGFAKGLKFKYNDIEVGFDFEPEPGLADNGNLEQDLQDLLVAVGEAAKSADTALVMFIDELQYVDESQLQALIAALHHTGQQELPVSLVGAGLPQLRARAGDAKSYAERLFEFPTVGALSDADARAAITKPLGSAVKIEDKALDLIIERTEGYPYFLQEWGKHAWLVAEKSPITVADVEQASIIAIATLDESFFHVRFDRTSAAEKRYLRAMAELGCGPHRSGDIARELGAAATQFGTTREGLIKKGMIWSPDYGKTAFTVPMFDAYMRRVMPGNEWRGKPAGKTRR